MNTLLFTAQDMNMTNGDYAFFTFIAIPPISQLMNPSTFFDPMSADQLSYRLQALYAVKQVSVTFCCGEHSTIL